MNITDSTQRIAGSDSTASSLRAMLYYLLKNPASYAKLQSEIDDFDREGKFSNPIAYAEANKMPYLQAVMKKAMRMHPAVGISMPRYVPSGGAEIDGRWYPAGTVVGVNAWVIHRNKEVFGEDADAFRPERWLEDDSKAKEMARNMYQVSREQPILNSY
jgi:cytochrome P450